MGSIVIACKTLKDELEKAIIETEFKHPVIWIESDYHINPDKLRDRLQQEIDGLADVEQVLLCYGSCGNALVGLEATSAKLIIPKIDDCIALLLTKPNQKLTKIKNTYFLTKGWIDGSKSILNEYTHTLNRYGKEKTDKIFQLMLKQYKYLMLIDTGAYDINKYKSQSKNFAQILNLEFIMEKGQLWFIKKILTGPYDDYFCVIEKGEKVTLEHFR